MNRLPINFALALLAMAASSACLAATPAASAPTRPAEDPAFCKSMCTSEQNVCRADARLQPKEERFAPVDMQDRNPFARGAQRQVARIDQRALDTAGDQKRTAQRLGSCDSAWQRCTQSCAAAPSRAMPAPANALSGK
jgi:hypothetical protein